MSNKERPGDTTHGEMSVEEKKQWSEFCGHLFDARDIMLKEVEGDPAKLDHRAWFIVDNFVGGLLGTSTGNHYEPGERDVERYLASHVADRFVQELLKPALEAWNNRHEKGSDLLSAAKKMEEGAPTLEGENPEHEKLEDEVIQELDRFIDEGGKSVRKQRKGLPVDRKL